MKNHKIVQNRSSTISFIQKKSDNPTHWLLTNWSIIYQYEYEIVLYAVSVGMLWLKCCGYFYLYSSVHSLTM